MPATRCNSIYMLQARIFPVVVVAGLSVGLGVSQVGRVTGVETTG